MVRAAIADVKAAGISDYRATALASPGRQKLWRWRKSTRSAPYRLLSHIVHCSVGRATTFARRIAAGFRRHDRSLHPLFDTGRRARRFAVGRQGQDQSSDFARGAKSKRSGASGRGQRHRGVHRSCQLVRGSEIESRKCWRMHRASWLEVLYSCWSRGSSSAGSK